MRRWWIYTDPTDGWVMPQETVIGGRIRGRYSLTFGSGTGMNTMQGTYDTTMGFAWDAGPSSPAGNGR